MLVTRCYKVLITSTNVPINGYKNINGSRTIVENQKFFLLQLFK